MVLHIDFVHVSVLITLSGGIGDRPWAAFSQPSPFRYFVIISRALRDVPAECEARRVVRLGIRTDAPSPKRHLDS